MTKPITIKDVAKQAGVSYKTVSRAINGEPHVSAEVREAVSRAVEELGYRPNAFARTLQGSRSSLVGLFIDDASSGYAADILSSALLRCRERGYHLMVEPVDMNHREWRTNLEASIKALPLEGAIIVPPICDDPRLLGMFQAANLPCVLISPGSVPSGGFCAVVQMNDPGATKEMVRHLLALGHRRIGFVMGPPDHGSSSRRHDAFVEAMAEAGVTPRAEDMVEGSFTFRSGMDAGTALLTRPDPPTAIFASNDDMALGVLICALKMGIAVPEQLSVAGFDDAPSSRLAWPQLTTIKQPKSNLAAAAVDLIVDWRKHAATGSPAKVFTLEHEIMIRESTAALPGGEVPNFR